MYHIHFLPHSNFTPIFLPHSFNSISSFLCVFFTQIVCHKTVLLTLHAHKTYHHNLLLNYLINLHLNVIDLVIRVLKKILVLFLIGIELVVSVTLDSCPDRPIFLFALLFINAPVGGRIAQLGHHGLRKVRVLFPQVEQHVHLVPFVALDFLDGIAVAWENDLLQMLLDQQNTCHIIDLIII